ncbi:hypothetical protein [Zhihengliuella flava]|uniref:Uncharacterized protein n=1 Tax=Zhihengliuella flava TaxID=1285193 RepID=A0A931GLZ4_9MICC|nr:hypothetical protein [Zhihengliuella flava]MBG6084919.1 hypothetical protein [Zhihengliuella flava]
MESQDRPTGPENTVWIDGNRVEPLEEEPEIEDDSAQTLPDGVSEDPAAEAEGPNEDEERFDAG